MVAPHDQADTRYHLLNHFAGSLFARPTCCSDARLFHIRWTDPLPPGTRGPEQTTIPNVQIPDDGSQRGENDGPVGENERSVRARLQNQERSSNYADRKVLAAVQRG